MRLRLKTVTGFIILAMVIISCSNKSQDNSSPRQTENFGRDWEFRRTAMQTGAFGAWQETNLPHAVKIEPLVVVKQWQGHAEYRKTFDIPVNPEKKYFIRFEGVMHEAEVFINGKALSHHVGGYLPFVVDITGYLHARKPNEIVVKTNNLNNPHIPPGKPLDKLDFCYYGGIYRNVWLITTNKVYVTDPVAAGVPAGGGLLAHFNDITPEVAKGLLKVHVENDFKEPKTVFFTATISGKDGSEFAINSKDVVINPRNAAQLQTAINIENPALWSPEHPDLYNMNVKVFANGELMDEVEQQTGIRKIELTEEGFFLNGEKRYLRGTNRHQEYPYVGYALSPEANYRDALKIKNAGFDFIRLSHYPHSESFMKACDELGLLTMDCIPGWQFFGDSVFVENSYDDCRGLIRRDRNHPSVIFWELSLNESQMTDAYMQEVNNILDEELPFDDAYSAGWIDNPAYDLFIPARQHAKPPDYWNFYRGGNRKIFIAEYGDWEYYAQNAGFNQIAFDDLKEDERTSRQLREYGEVRLLQQALNFQEAKNSNRKGIGTIGDANWLMYDYNRGYNPDLEASGISSIARLPKFAYWFYQSQQPPEVLNIENVKSGPMVIIATYWTESSPPDVKVYSNCEEVELFLNGESLGRQKPTENQYSAELRYPPFVFNIEKFEPGTLRAIAFNDGDEVAEDVVKTPGKSTTISLKADLSGKPLNPDYRDVIFIYARITDDDGSLVSSSDVPVTFTLEGDDRLIGDNPAPAKAGIATILLETQGLKNPLTIRAESGDLRDGEVVIRPGEAR